jgi:hypothetical protein
MRPPVHPAGGPSKHCSTNGRRLHARRRRARGSPGPVLANVSPERLGALSGCSCSSGISRASVKTRELVPGERDVGEDVRHDVADGRHAPSQPPGRDLTPLAGRRQYREPREEDLCRSVAYTPSPALVVSVIALFVALGGELRGDHRTAGEQRRHETDQERRCHCREDQPFCARGGEGRRRSRRARVSEPV